MMEDELIALWQSSPKHERIKFEKSKLMLEVQSNLDVFDKAVQRRDYIEIGAAFIVIPIFGYQVVNQPNSIAKVGAIWIILYVFFVIYKLLKIKKVKPNEAISYIDYLKQRKAYLEKQKRLLESVLYWYILPCMVGCVIMMIGVLDLPNKSWWDIAKMWRIWTALSIFALVGAFINWINKRGVKKEINPRLEKVETLLKLLKE